MEGRIRILLVDDHPILRKGLHMVIRSQKDMDVVGEASSVEEAIRLTHELAPDLVILDLSLPGKSGLDFITEIKKLGFDTKVLVLTIHDDEAYIKRVLIEGGNGYLLKKAADAELLLAIRSVARGEMFLDPSLTRDFLEGIIRPGARKKKTEKDITPLSPRQKEILAMIAQGYSDRQIAEKLYISVKTVESHKARIKEKLNLAQRSDLVQYALRGRQGDSTVIS